MKGLTLHVDYAWKGNKMHNYSRPTTKFWNTKSNKLRLEATRLRERNPALLAVLCFASWYAWNRWQKKITITSVFRDDDTVHGDERGADLRIFNELRDGAEAEKIELLPREGRELVHAINSTFDYGRTWTGRKTVVAHYRELGDSPRDTAEHIHLQTRKRFWKM